MNSLADIDNIVQFLDSIPPGPKLTIDELRTKYMPRPSTRLSPETIAAGVRVLEYYQQVELNKLARVTPVTPAAPKP